jgi:hypothetical protein
MPPMSMSMAERRLDRIYLSEELLNIFDLSHLPRSAVTHRVPKQYCQIRDSAAAKHDTLQWRWHPLAWTCDASRSGDYIGGTYEEPRRCNAAFTTGAISMRAHACRQHLCGAFQTVANMRPEQ